MDDLYDATDPSVGYNNNNSNTLATTSSRKRFLISFGVVSIAVSFVLLNQSSFGNSNNGNDYYTRQYAAGRNFVPKNYGREPSSKKSFAISSSSSNNAQARPTLKRNKPLSAVSLGDLEDVDDDFLTTTLSKKSDQQILEERMPVLKLLAAAGISIDNDLIKTLPSWSSVSELYGDKPVIIGMDTCERFRKANSRDQRFVGVAGQMNVGTNALAKYLHDNLQIKQNSFSAGMLVNVPWHKHGWTSMRTKYKFSPPQDVNSVLPVVLIRDPYFWMQSMCTSPYTMRWEHTPEACNIVQKSVRNRSFDAFMADESIGNPVDILWGNDHQRVWQSLAHVWSEWYREYYEADFPRLMIRFEDLLFHTEEVISMIRECAGAEWRENEFVYTSKAIKQADYFTKIKPQSSMLSAIIKYGQDKGQRTNYLTDVEKDYTTLYLDRDLMRTFHYHHPF